MKARNLQNKLMTIPQMGWWQAFTPSRDMARMPDGDIDLFIEPFLGGGAVFLDLVRQGRIKRILNDQPELVHTREWSEMNRVP